MSWLSEYGTRPQTQEEINKLFSNERQNIGCIAGNISRNLVLLDFDARTGLNKALQDKSFARIYGHTTISQSGRKARGVHCWIRTPEPIKCSKNKDYNLDIKGEGGYCVEPPSLHKGNNELYLFENGYQGILELNNWNDIPDIMKTWFQTITEPTLNPEQLSLLKKSIIQNEVKTGYYYFDNIGMKAMNILKNPSAVQDYNYHSRSEAECSLILRCVSMGWDINHIKELIRRMGHSELKSQNTAWFERVYNNCKNYYISKQSELDKKIISLYNQLIEYNPFDGLTARTDHAVCITILKLIRHAGKTEISFSCRQLAELTGMTAKTINLSLKRLPLKYITTNEYNTYIYDCNELLNFLISTLLQYTTKHLTQANVVYCSHLDIKDNLKHDSMRKSGLNKLDIINILDIGMNGNIQFWMEKFNSSINTTKRKLELLEKVNIITIEGKRNIIYFCIKKPDIDTLETIARITGTAGAGLKQKILHEKQREDYLMSRKAQAKRLREKQVITNQGAD